MNMPHLKRASGDAVGTERDKSLALPIMGTIARALETDTVALYLPSDKETFTLAASTHDGHGPHLSALKKDSALINLLMSNPTMPQLHQTVSGEAELRTFEKLGAQAVIPLSVDGDLRGFLTIAPSDSGKSYTESEVRLLSAILPQLISDNHHAPTPQNNAKTGNEELLLLSRLIRIVNSDLEIGNVYNTFIAELRAVLFIDYAHVALIEEEMERLTVVAIFPPTNPIRQLGDIITMKTPAVEWFLSHRESHYQPDLQSETSFKMDASLLTAGIRSVARLPLFYKDNVVGSFDVGSRIPNAFTPDDLELLRQVADHLALATKNSQLYEQERTWRQKLENQDKERTIFIDALVHELKTPLSAVVGSSELLLHEIPQNHPLHELAKNIDFSGRTLIRRVSDLTHFAQIQSTVFALNLQPVDIPLQVKYSAAELQPLLQNKHQKLNLALPDNLPQANADPGRIEQVLLNLLSNAIKFSPPDSQIDVNVYARDSHLIVEVTDTAPPITPEDTARIFTPYYRAEQVKRTPGLGLGLAICKRLMELHRGSIWVKTYHKGNIFSIALPLAQHHETNTIGVQGEPH